MNTPVLRILGPLAISLLLCPVSPAQGNKPPQEIQALSTHTAYSWELVGPGTPGQPQGRLILARVGVVTMEKQVQVSWTAQADQASGINGNVVKLHTSFYPTDVALSSDRQGFYVAGCSGGTPVLEKWTAGNYTIASQTAASGPPTTTFIPPEFSRVPLLVDPSIQNICSIAAFNWTVGGAEEVWVMEWESRKVYVTDQQSGLKEEKGAGIDLSDFRTMHQRKHSIYGHCMVFTRRPWWYSAGSWRDATDTNHVILYDSDLDGVVDGSFDIPYADMDSHVFYTTGQRTEW